MLKLRHARARTPPSATEPETSDKEPDLVYIALTDIEVLRVRKRVGSHWPAGLAVGFLVDVTAVLIAGAVLRNTLYTGP